MGASTSDPVLLYCATVTDGRALLLIQFCSRDRVGSGWVQAINQQESNEIVDFD